MIFSDMLATHQVKEGQMLRYALTDRHLVRNSKELTGVLVNIKLLVAELSQADLQASEKDHVHAKPKANA